MKQVVLYTATILAVVSGAIILWMMREAVQLLLLALALAAALTPAVQRLTRRGVSLVRAVGLIYGIVLVGLSGFALIVGSLAYAELVQAITVVPEWYETTRRELLAAGDWRRNLERVLPTTSAIAAWLAGSGLEDLGPRIVGLAASIGAGVVLLFGVAALGFYWLLDQPRIERLWLSLLPLRARVTARTLWEQISREVGIYVRGETTIVLLTVVALTSAYAIADLPGAVTLALAGGLIQVIPLIGLPLALAPALLVALTRDLPTLLITLLLGLTVLGIIKGVIARRVFREGINVNPVLLVVVIMILANIAGIVAILLAPPLTAAIQTSARVLTSERRQQAQRSQTVQLQSLSQQLAILEMRIAPEHPSYVQLQALLLRARKLLDTASADLPDTPPLEAHAGTQVLEIGRDAKPG